MTSEEIINIANVIQFPVNYEKYYLYSIGKKIYRLPLPKKDEMYDNWPLNTNHFTTEYHRKYVIPLLCKLLNIQYIEDDFILDKHISQNKFDISLLKSKKEYIYDIYGYKRNNLFRNVKFNDLISCDIISPSITDYHKLYKYPHECSRITNKTINTNRKLFISGDSQMIPNVSFLSCFFKEIFYFDNRLGLKLSHTWKDIDFTDAIIEFNASSIQTYILNFL